MGRSPNFRATHHIIFVVQFSYVIYLLVLDIFLILDSIYTSTFALFLKKLWTNMKDKSFNVLGNKMSFLNFGTVTNRQ